MQHKFVTLELGPEVVAWSTRVGDDIVCVMTPTSLKDASARRTARKMVRRLGADCRICRACPLGQAD